MDPSTAPQKASPQPDLNPRRHPPPSTAPTYPAGNVDSSLNNTTPHTPGRRTAPVHHTGTPPHPSRAYETPSSWLSITPSTHTCSPISQRRNTHFTLDLDQNSYRGNRRNTRSCKMPIMNKLNPPPTFYNETSAYIPEQTIHPTLSQQPKL